jgi:hypothetical protein
MENVLGLFGILDDQGSHYNNKQNGGLPTSVFGHTGCNAKVNNFLGRGWLSLAPPNLSKVLHMFEIALKSRRVVTYYISAYACSYCRSEKAVQA